MQIFMTDSKPIQAAKDLIDRQNIDHKKIVIGLSNIIFSACRKMYNLETPYPGMVSNAPLIWAIQNPGNLGWLMAYTIELIRLKFNYLVVGKEERSLHVVLSNLRHDVWKKDHGITEIPFEPTCLCIESAKIRLKEGGTVFSAYLALLELENERAK